MPSAGAFLCLFVVDNVFSEGVDLDLSCVVAIDHVHLPGLLAIIIFQLPPLRLALFSLVLGQLSGVLAVDGLVQVEGVVLVVVVELGRVAPPDLTNLGVDHCGVLLLLVEAVDLVLVPVALGLQGNLGHLGILEQPVEPLDGLRLIELDIGGRSPGRTDSC